MKFIEIINKYWALLTITLLIAISFLSLWPLEKLPGVPGTDKTHHFIAYAVLMFPTALRKPKNWKIYGICFVGYSGLIELVQPFVNRYGEWLDMLANMSGVMIGICLAALVNVIVGYKQRSIKQNLKQKRGLKGP